MAAAIYRRVEAERADGYNRSADRELNTPMIVPAHTRLRWSPLLRRTFWLLMCAAHAPALAAAWGALLSGGATRPDGVRLIGLSLSAVFFGLKLFDVAWLRIRTGRAGWIALAVIVALIHAQALGVVAPGQFAPQVLAVLSAALFVEPIRQPCERWAVRLATWLSVQPVRRNAARVRRFESLHVLIDLPRWRASRLAMPPRAPPA